MHGPVLYAQRGGLPFLATAATARAEAAGLGAAEEARLAGERRQRTVADQLRAQASLAEARVAERAQEQLMAEQRAALQRQQDGQRQMALLTATAAEQQRSSSGPRRSSQRERQRGSAPPLPQTWRRLESSLRASRPGRLASRRWLLSDRRCRSSRSRQRRSGTRRPLGRTPPKHRAAEAEERRRAKAEEAEAARTEGRRQLAEGRYLSAKASAAGTHKRGPNKRARKNARKKENEALAAEQEAVEAQQAQLAAERAAFVLQQAQAGAPLDLFEQARAASAAIADSGLRRQHENMVKVAAAHMDALVTAPAEGPARLDQRLAGAAATIVAGTKKVTSDLKQRQRQDKGRQKFAPSVQL